MAVSAIPKGFTSITPYLIIDGAQQAICFYSDAFPDESFKSPSELGGTSVSLMLYVEDVDAVFNKAIELGATQIRPVHDQFYGDRAGTLQDPYGHMWTIGTHKEDLTDQEINRRMADLMSKEQDA